MPKKPYPGFPPNYKAVDETAGYTRTCVVLEFLSLGPLDSVALAMVQEQLEALTERLQRRISYIENTDVILPDRFDPVLREGLRLS
jgi:hypothetical protein